MNGSGASDLMRHARTVLLDALDALEKHRDALILIGAQAIYLHTDAARVALPELTKDSDLAIDRRKLADDPLLERAMMDADFEPIGDAGRWRGAFGVPVDLMIPESMSDGGGRRGGRMAPHSKRATRKATGLEAAIVDNAPMTIAALDPMDRRRIEIKVAGPAALLIAKMHKLGDREVDEPERMRDKDAHDVYRLLVALETQVFVNSLERLRLDDLAGDATKQGLGFFEQLFATGPEAVGCVMAGRAEELLGDPETVAAATAALAADLVNALH
jgi:hypothetical protein